MNKYLVEIESGKNNIGGNPLNILRGSRIYEANSVEEAYDIAQVYKINHWGHTADYTKITSITLLIDK